MLQTTTVVTPERFAQGMSYADFIAQATVNRDKFEKYYNEPVLAADDIAFFKRAASSPNGPARMLALAEAWCGDVYRELPTAVRIAEATGIELRIFLRDQNPDIMDEFLLNGKARAIPVSCSIRRRPSTSHTSPSAPRELMPSWRRSRTKWRRKWDCLRGPRSRRRPRRASRRFCEK